jgi:hypothetical protein
VLRHHDLEELDHVQSRLAQGRKRHAGLAEERGRRREDLGKPDTQSGQQAKDSLDQLSSDLNTDSDAIKTAVDDVTDLSGVPAAVTTIGTTLQTMQSQVTSTVNSLKQLDAPGELQTAFQQSSACQQLSSSRS